MEPIPFVIQFSAEVKASFREVTAEQQRLIGHHCYTKLKAGLGKDF